MKLEFKEVDYTKSCRVCGGALVEIRPKHPGGENRKVCPTCLADRMDLIREYSDRDYGVAYQAKP